MKPVVDGLKRTYEGKVEFRLLNVEKDSAANDLAVKLGVTGVPTFIFVNSDGVQAGQIIGSASASALTKVLDTLK